MTTKEKILIHPLEALPQTFILRKNRQTLLIFAFNILNYFIPLQNPVTFQQQPSPLFC